MTTEICSQTLCTGCGACVAACPKRCISLQPNPQGHLLPVIDIKTCVNCNLCRKTCPVNSPVPLHEPNACYAGWAKDEQDRTTSSSGAASSVFAVHFIQKGGIVYGAALQDQRVQHIRVSKMEDLARIKGSKYVYSYAAEVYPQIKQDLSDGKQVLFLGSPCQNAAVYNLVGDNPNLTLVNLICHGVPSMQILLDHLKSKHITEIKKIQFRNNNDTYNFCCNDYKALEHIFPDIYVTCFLKGYTYRDSCYNCAYAQAKRTGDITIGDFWGLGKETPFEGGDTSKGCSVIIINTSKGKELLETCQGKLQLFPRKYQEAVDGNSQLRAPVSQKKLASKFNKYYPKYSFNMAVWLTVPRLLGIRVLKNILKRYTPVAKVQKFLKNLFS